MTPTAILLSGTLAQALAAYSVLMMNTKSVWPTLILAASGTVLTIIGGTMLTAELWSRI